MEITFENIAQVARQLPYDEKAALAQLLFEELGSGQFASKEIEAAWIEESERRLDAYLRGEMTASPTEEVIARVRSRIGR